MLYFSDTSCMRGASHKLFFEHTQRYSEPVSLPVFSYEFVVLVQHLSFDCPIYKLITCCAVTPFVIVLLMCTRCMRYKFHCVGALLST